MRYSFDFKLKCVKNYKSGIQTEIPEKVSKTRFNQYIRIWVRLYDAHGENGLKHKSNNEFKSVDEKIELIKQIKGGLSIGEVSINSGVSAGLLCKWVKIYDEIGYNGLKELKRGRKPMKNKLNDNPEKINVKPLDSHILTENEKEEIEHLRIENIALKAENIALKAENAKIIELKTENAVIKKEIALREEREAAQLKAKKQR